MQKYKDRFGIPCSKVCTPMLLIKTAIKDPVLVPVAFPLNLYTLGAFLPENIHPQFPMTPSPVAMCDLSIGGRENDRSPDQVRVSSSTSDRASLLIHAGQKNTSLGDWGNSHREEGENAIFIFPGPNAESLKGSKIKRRRRRNLVINKSRLPELDRSISRGKFFFKANHPGKIIHK